MYTDEHISDKELLLLRTVDFGCGGQDFQSLRHARDSDLIKQTPSVRHKLTTDFHWLSFYSRQQQR